MRPIPICRNHIASSISPTAGADQWRQLFVFLCIWEREPHESRKLNNRHVNKHEEIQWKSNSNKRNPKEQGSGWFLRQDYKIWFGRSVTKRDVAIFGMWKSESTKTGSQSSSKRNKMEERKKKSILAGFSERGVWVLFLIKKRSIKQGSWWEPCLNYIRPATKAMLRWPSRISSSKMSRKEGKRAGTYLASCRHGEILAKAGSAGVPALGTGHGTATRCT